MAIPVLAMLAFPLCAAVQPPAKPRPKIGVALAGGAALGLSHIGVIKWFEENRIPIDYIAGTSMGGLIAGLYATGHTADEMIEFARKIDWVDATRLEPSFETLTYRRKEDRRAFPTIVELGLKQGVSFPPGLSPGHGVGKVISRFAAPYDGLSSFDSLPIPFRCVASDLISGNQVVFSSGNLFDALRSTMSIPGVFAPWKVGDKIMVDGATLNNVPVDVVRKMGADIVIAVALETPPIKEKDVRSFFGVAGRSISIMIMDNERRSLALADVIVAADLKGFTGTQYDRSEEFFKVGYAGAAQKAKVLERFSLSPEEFAAHMKSRRERRLPESITPAAIEVTGATAATAALIDEEFQRDYKGKPLDQARLETGLDRLAGFGVYSSADYSLSRSPAGDGLKVRVHQKEYGPPFLNLLLILDAASGEGFRFGIGGRFTLMNVLRPRAEWRTDINIGGINGVSSEYYMPFGTGRFFAAPRAGYQKGEVPFYSGGDEIASLETESGGVGMDLGFAQSRYTEWRLGYSFSHDTASVSSGQPLFPGFAGNFNVVRVRFAHDHQDSHLIPRKGFRNISEAQWVANSPASGTGFLVLQSKASYARMINPKWLTVSSVEGGLKPDRADRIPPFTLGGLTRLSALSRNQAFGNQYYYGGMAILRTLNERPSLFGRFYAGLLLELGNAFTGDQNKNPYYNAGIGLTGETPIGLVYFGYSIGDKGMSKLQFRVGRLF